MLLPNRQGRVYNSMSLLLDDESLPVTIAVVINNVLFIAQLVERLILQYGEHWIDSILEEKEYIS